MAGQRKPDALTGALLKETKQLIETSRRLVEASQREAAEAHAYAAKTKEIILASRKHLKRPKAD
jgi:hypothetical protein